MADAFEREVLAVGQGEQGLERIVDLTLGNEAIGACGIETGLGLEYVGTIGQADLEALVGLVQLPLERRFLGLQCGEVVLRAQHGEVGLRALQDQVLFGDGVFQRRLLADGLGGFELEPAIGAEQRLAQRCLVGGAAARQRARAQMSVDIRFSVAQFCAGAEIGQQPGTCLRYHLLARAELRTGGREVGVVVDRMLVDADQIGTAGERGFGQGRPGEDGCHGDGQGKSVQHLGSS